MNLGSLSEGELATRLEGEGLFLSSGPFIFRIRSCLPRVRAGLRLAYADYPLAEPGYADFHVRVAAPNWLRRWVSPQVQFYFDQHPPFLPLPRVQAHALLEWGMNWCVSQHANRYLILHAAVLEKNGRALLLPGISGSGKSTLCAALCYRGGWRLLSDELTLIRPWDCLIQPLPRPVSLKNASIGVIQALAPEVPFTKVVHDTLKGTVAHGRPPADSVARQGECPPPGWVVFPKYRAGAVTRLEALPPAPVGLELAEQAFNYSLHGRRGYETLCGLLDRVSAWRFEYSDTDEALSLFERLAAGECLAEAAA
ncbi:MAG: HprK-related kinase A [Gammaproteobacteria bacterium]|nr:HprK-related kinase A [Gammaproteobacteria bacterium]